MKFFFKCFLVFMLASSTICLMAQTTTKTTTTSKSSSTKKTKSSKTSSGKSTAAKTAAPVSRKEISITLKSLAEKNTSIFAGAKEDLKQAKVQTAGGLSQNTLYIKENDVVCIMDAAKKPVSCANVKPGTKLVEINSSGTAITAK